MKSNELTNFPFLYFFFVVCLVRMTFQLEYVDNVAILSNLWKKENFDLKNTIDGAALLTFCGSEQMKLNKFSVVKHQILKLIFYFYFHLIRF